eukprot:1158632-Pelagomonas_calceolata.AAC.5
MDQVGPFRTYMPHVSASWQGKHEGYNIICEDDRHSICGRHEGAWGSLDRRWTRPDCLTMNQVKFNLISIVCMATVHQWSHACPLL